MTKLPSKLYLVVEFINETPAINGSIFFETMEECGRYIEMKEELQKELPLEENGIKVKYRISEILMGEKTNGTL